MNLFTRTFKAHVFSLLYRGIRSTAQLAITQSYSCQGAGLKSSKQCPCCHCNQQSILNWLTTTNTLKGQQHVQYLTQVIHLSRSNVYGHSTIQTLCDDSNTLELFRITVSLCHMIDLHIASSTSPVITVARFYTEHTWCNVAVPTIAVVSISLYLSKYVFVELYKNTDQYVYLLSVGMITHIILVHLLANFSSYTVQVQYCTLSSARGLGLCFYVNLSCEMCIC